MIAMSPFQFALSANSTCFDSLYNKVIGWNSTIYNDSNTFLKRSIHRHQTPPQHRIAIRPITAKRDVIHKAEVHNIVQRRQRRTEPRPHGICTENFVKIGPVVPEICSQTDRHTN